MEYGLGIIKKRGGTGSRGGERKREGGSVERKRTGGERKGRGNWESVGGVRKKRGKKGRREGT